MKVKLVKKKISKILYVILGFLTINVIIWTFVNFQHKYPDNVKQELITKTQTVEVETIIIPDMEIIYYDCPQVSNLTDIEYQLNQFIQKREQIEEIVNNLTSLGYNDQRINTWSEFQLEEIERCIQYYQEQYDLIIQEQEEELWNKRMKEYPTATTIWLFLKEQGFNDYVAAGILGNMMTEAGGQSLNINPYASSGSYYGICQWGPSFSGRYTGLEGQLDLLMDTIENEFNWYGTMSYENFCNLENEKDAALAFAKSYERCTSASYGQRKTNATKALEYFS